MSNHNSPRPRSHRAPKASKASQPVQTDDIDLLRLLGIMAPETLPGVSGIESVADVFAHRDLRRFALSLAEVVLNDPAFAEAFKAGEITKREVGSNMMLNGLNPADVGPLFEKVGIFAPTPETGDPAVYPGAAFDAFIQAAKPELDTVA